MAGMLIEQRFQEGDRRGRSEQELVDAPWRAVDQQELAVAHPHAAALRQPAHPGLELRRALPRRVAVGDPGEMVVARIGVAAVAVLAAGGERLLVIALDRPYVPLDEQGPDLLGIRAEAAEVAQAVDRLGSAAGGVLEQRAQAVVVVVDAAEDGDARPGALDLRRIREGRRVVADCRGPLRFREPLAGLGARAAELVQRNELLPPGGETAVERHPLPLLEAAGLLGGFATARHGSTQVLQLTP